MQPVRITVSLAAADDDGICLSQTPLAGGNLTITGALASGGVATLTPVTAARQVIITCAGNELARTFTIYGTANGSAFSEALAGASGGIAASVAMFTTVTRVAVDAATADAVKVGTNGVGASSIINPDMNMAPFAIGIGTVLNSGSANWTVQHTFNDIYSSGTYAPAGYTWFANSGLTGKSANADGNYAFPVTGIRLLINSGTGSVTMTLIQAVTTP